jgi:hypothetical protein
VGRSRRRRGMDLSNAGMIDRVLQAPIKLRIDQSISILAIPTAHEGKIRDQPRGISDSQETAYRRAS